MKAEAATYWLVGVATLLIAAVVGCSNGVNPPRTGCPEEFEVPVPLDDYGAVGCHRIGFLNGVMVIQFWDEKEQPWGTFFARDDMANGPFKLYYPGGKIHRSGFAVSGNVAGSLTTYWPNGMVQRMDFLWGGKQNGRQYFYDSLGQLLSELTLVDDSRTGVAKWYHAADVLKSESLWSYGYKYDRAYGYDVIGNLIWMEYNGLDCDGKPCLEYAILWDEAGKAIDSSGRAIETGDATVYERIRSGKYCPSLPVDKERLRYLLGTSCD